MKNTLPSPTMRLSHRLFALLPGVVAVAAALPLVGAANPVSAARPPAQKTTGTVRGRVAPPPPSLEPHSTATVPDDAKQLISEAPLAEKFPDAAKVTLNDLMDVTVRPDGSARFWVRQTLRVFNKRGRDTESEISIPYNNSYETVKILRARTIKPDGTIVPVDLNDVRDQNVDESGDAMYTDAKKKTFSMPAVDDGAIIDYEYVMEQKPMMGGNFWTPWYFQSGFDPVKLTRLTVTIPKSMKLNIQQRNTSVKPTTKDLPDGKNVRYVWQDKDVAPLELEPMMPELERFQPMLFLTTVPAWQSVADWYTDLAKTQQTLTPDLKKKTAELIAGKSTPEEKAKAIFYYVEEKTRYVSIDFGKSAFQPHAANLVCANQYGDCKDMANLLVTMLHEAGVKAYPVLLNAGSKLKRSELPPSPAAFDHAICLAEIDGKQYWLDATASVCAWNEIPGGDRGAEVFVIRDGQGIWQTIPDGTPDDNKTIQDVRLTLNADGSAKGSITLSGTGDTDMSLRATLSYLPPDKITPYLESIAQNIGPNPHVTNITSLDYKDKDKPVRIVMDVTFPAWANQSDDVLIFKARPEQSKGADSSPFRNDFRRLPVTQPSAAMAVSSLEVKLPVGYSILSSPKTIDVKSSLGRLYRSVDISGDQLKVEIRGENYHADVPAFQYDDVRKYYDSYLRTLSQSVIVKKN